MYFPLDPKECRSAARRYRERALRSAAMLRDDFEHLALAYEELADLLGAEQTAAGRIAN
jgi:hypothetical protein